MVEIRLAAPELRAIVAFAEGFGLLRDESRAGNHRPSAVDRLRTSTNNRRPGNDPQAACRSLSGSRDLGGTPPGRAASNAMARSQRAPASCSSGHGGTGFPGPPRRPGPCRGCCCACCWACCWGSDCSWTGCRCCELPPAAPINAVSPRCAMSMCASPVSSAAVRAAGARGSVALAWRCTAGARPLGSLLVRVATPSPTVAARWPSAARPATSTSAATAATAGKPSPTTCRRSTRSASRSRGRSHLIDGTEKPAVC